MEYLLVLFVLNIIHCSHGNSPDLESPDKFKLSAEPGYFRPKQSSNLNSNEKTNPLAPEMKDKHESETKDDDSNFKFYKPLTSFQHYGPSEEDSKYIPHSKIFSKYIIPKENLNFDIKNDRENKEDHDQDEDKKESDEIPRYGFVREKHNDDLPKDYSDKNAEDVPLKHSKNELNNHYQKPFHHKSSYEQHSKEKSNDYKTPEHHDHMQHDTYPEQNNEYRYDQYPEHEKKHRHLYPEYKAHRQPYPEYEEEHRHTYPEYKERKPYDYPNVKEEKEYSHNIDSKENYQHHLNPEYKGKYEHDHYSDDKEIRGHHSYSDVKRDYDEHHHPNHEEYAKHHIGKHDDQKEKHHNLDKNIKHYQYHHPRDSHSDKTVKISETKKYYMPQHHTLHEDKFRHNPPINDFLKGHKLDFPKILHQMHDDKVHHKIYEHVDDVKTHHPSPKHYLHMTKYHKGHQFKSFLNNKPFFNVGGHSYGGMYKPKVDIHQQLKKDLDLRIKLFKEHEEKLAELQRGHLQKYRALFEPVHAKKYFNYELSQRIIPGVSRKYHSHLEIDNEKNEHEHSSDIHQSQYYPDMQKFTEHEPKHYLPLHHDSHHPKNEFTNEENKHYNHDSQLASKE